jgi:hypothetical protein
MQPQRGLVMTRLVHLDLRISVTLLWSVSKHWGLVIRQHSDSKKPQFVT